MTSRPLIRYDSLKTPAENLAELKRISCIEPDDLNSKHDPPPPASGLTVDYVRACFFNELVRVAQSYARSALESRRPDIYALVIQFLQHYRGTNPNDVLDEAQDDYVRICKTLSKTRTSSIKN